MGQAKRRKLAGSYPAPTSIKLSKSDRVALTRRLLRRLETDRVPLTQAIMEEGGVSEAEADAILWEMIEVMGAHMRGELRPVDSAAARKVVDSEAKAFAAAPELMRELTLLARGKERLQ